MRTALPVITDDGENLKQRRQREHEGRKTPRLHMRYVLASGHAPTRQAVAQRLGVHRNTIGHWLAISARGGLEALLALYVPAGQPLSRAPAVLAAIDQALRAPAGFASDEALRQGVQQRQHGEVTYHTPDTSVRARVSAQLTGPRPRHTKNPGRRR
jgi:alkylhydroperoxidase family enzyme